MYGNPLRRVLCRKFLVLIKSIVSFLVMHLYMHICSHVCLCIHVCICMCLCLYILPKGKKCMCTDLCMLCIYCLEFALFNESMLCACQGSIVGTTYFCVSFPVYTCMYLYVSMSVNPTKRKKIIVYQLMFVMLPLFRVFCLQ